MVKRGQIYYIDNNRQYQAVDSEQNSGRPAIIVSNDKNNKYSEVVEVVYLTTQPKNDLPTHVRINSTHRLSTALCEQITTVSISRIGDYISTCSETEMMSIDIALAISLGIDFDALNSGNRDGEVVDDKNDSASAECDADYIKTVAERDVYKSQYEWLLSRFVGSDK